MNNNELVCKCGNNMRLDDTDYNFKGNYNNYFICDKCTWGCQTKVRYGKTIRRDWYERG